MGKDNAGYPGTGAGLPDAAAGAAEISSSNLSRRLRPVHILNHIFHLRDLASSYLSHSYLGWLSYTEYN